MGLAGLVTPQSGRAHGATLRVPSRPAGGGNPGAVREYRKVPIWVFHGAEDKVVPVSQSQVMVEALKEVRSGVKYTEFAGAGHGVADRVYDDEKVHEWIFEQGQ